MSLTRREREYLERMSRIGRRDLCQKQIAAEMGLSYSRASKLRRQIMLKLGYRDFIGLMCDYVRGEAE